MVDLNHQIPPELYKAIAEILLFVYNLKNNRNQSRITKEPNNKNNHDYAGKK